MSSPPPVKPVPQVCWLDTQSLHTSLAPLRSSAPPPAQLAPVLSEMPLRVARRDDGSFEVLDGIKRLAQWMSAGHAQVPVIVEQACSALEQKVLLLHANAPPRSLTAMDEARVVDSLIREDGQTEAAVRRATGRRPGWVSRRLVLARQLAPSLRDKVDHRELGPSLAYALCALPAPQQESVVTLRAQRPRSLQAFWQREVLSRRWAWDRIDSGPGRPYMPDRNDRVSERPSSLASRFGRGPLRAACGERGRGAGC
jgi:ParB-like chromosome segregation protein Spo0J